MHDLLNVILIAHASKLKKNNANELNNDGTLTNCPRKVITAVTETDVRITHDFKCIEH